MTNKVVDCMKSTMLDAVTSVKLQERNDARTILHEVLNSLSDNKIKGIAFEWVEGSMHIRQSVMVNGTVNHFLLCLHEDPCGGDCTCGEKSGG